MAASLYSHTVRMTTSKADVAQESRDDVGHKPYCTSVPQINVLMFSLGGVDKPSS
jgi:hypothetical protein